MARAPVAVLPPYIKTGNFSFAGASGVGSGEAEALIQGLSNSSDADTYSGSLLEVKAVWDEELQVAFRSNILNKSATLVVHRIGAMSETSDPIPLFECFSDAGADFLHHTGIITTDTGAGRCEVVDVENIGTVDDEGFDLEHHVFVSKIGNGCFDKLGVARRLDDDGVVGHFISVGWNDVQNSMMNKLEVMSSCLYGTKQTSPSR